MTTSEPQQIGDWIVEAGLGWLPQKEQHRLADLVYQRLQERVGARLSSGMTDEQLDEFTVVTEGEERQLAEWLESAAPDFLEDQIWSNLCETAPEAPPSVLLREYASLKWLSLNAPNYSDVVAKAREEIKDELRTLAAQLADSREEAGRSR